MDSSPIPELPAANRREVLAWAIYDWANSAYSTISITVLVKYLIFVMDQVRPDMGGAIWGYGIWLTTFCAAILSPVLGAVADAHASKRRWLALTALTGATAASLMFFATPERPWLLVALFLVAHLSFELSFSFYNAFLPEIATEKTMGRVSAWGYALGYLGGGLALAIVLALFSIGPQLGLPKADADSTALLPRLSLLLMGLWWGIFTLPTLYWLKDRSLPKRNPEPFPVAARQALKEVVHTLRNVRRYRTLAIFLVGFLVYNDGVQTVITQASVFADKVLSMETAELAQVVLMIQFVAIPGAWLIDFLADRLGQKIALSICLAIWVGLLIGAFFITTTLHFWILAVVVGLVLGGIQSVSRAIMGLMTPVERTGEFFGFFSFSSKAVSIMGPAMFATVVLVTDDAKLGLVSLLLFFIIGWAIVSRVDIAQGQREAQEAE